jgi:hypothetical protein
MKAGFKDRDSRKAPSPRETAVEKGRDGTGPVDPRHLEWEIRLLILDQAEAWGMPEEWRARMRYLHDTLADAADFYKEWAGMLRARRDGNPWPPKRRVRREQ